MICRPLACRLVAGLAFSTLLGASAAAAAPPTPAQALALGPVQKEIDYDVPTAAEIGSCTIQAVKEGDSSSWVVRDGGGEILRKFTDSNNDNVVDRWSYYKNGLEVYRDIDANFNNKADQYRWFHTGGSRWGVDRDEDGKVDSWRTISAEEVAGEAIAALRSRDAERFAALLATPDELKTLGLAAEQAKEIGDKLSAAPAEFRNLAARQTKITAKTQYIDFGSAQPGVVPAGVNGSTKDILVYEGVAALVDTEGKAEQILIGTLVRIDDAWRMIDVPHLQAGDDLASAGGIFFETAMARRIEADGGSQGPSAEAQRMMQDLEKLDAQVGTANPQQLEGLNRQRAALLEKLANETNDRDLREQWIRQLADTVSAAVQSGALVDGVSRLTSLQQKLAGQPSDKALAAYVRFRLVSAEYAKDLQDPKADYVKVQAKWVEDLEDYVKENPKTPETPEALLQLAIAGEFSGQDETATTWYRRIVTDFPSSQPAQKAQGAVRRLTSVGKTMTLRGNDLRGSTVDISQYKGRIVLVQYWATWCEPCKSDMAVLKELKSKYAKAKFEVLGVSLDNSREDVADFVKQERLPWVQIYESGGLESRLANEMGVLTLPTMILLDGQGRVVNRGIHISEVESELKKLLQ